MRGPIVFCLVVLVPFCSARAGVREWTDSTGKYTTNAELIGVEGDQVRLRRSDGQLITVPLGRLSEADQRFALAAPSERQIASNPAPRPAGERADVPPTGNANGFSTSGTAVRPGRDAISRALRAAPKWATLVLQPGTYTEPQVLEVDRPVMITGDASGRTMLRGVALGLTGGPVILRHLQFVPGETETSSTAVLSLGVPVRIERCLFQDYSSMAVVLKESPLCDVVQCDFVRCRFGVWINDGASPTVWGCRFDACRTGVGCLRGTPYLADNLFLSNTTAFSMTIGEPTVVRNNVVVRSGTDFRGGNHEDELVRAVVYNNVFYESPSVKVACRAWFSHNLFFQPQASRWEPNSDNVKEGKFLTFDPGYANAISGDLSTTRSSQLRHRGFKQDLQRFGRAEEDTDTIGLTDPTFVAGTRGPESAQAPFRWSEPFIVHGIGEAEQVVNTFRPGTTIQRISRALDQSIDIWILDQGEVRFDTVRFFPTLFLQ